MPKADEARGAHALEEDEAKVLAPRTGYHSVRPAAKDDEVMFESGTGKIDPCRYYGFLAVILFLAVSVAVFLGPNIDVLIGLPSRGDTARRGVVEGAMQRETPAETRPPLKAPPPSAVACARGSGWQRPELAPLNVPYFSGQLPPADRWEDLFASFRSSPEAPCSSPVQASARLFSFNVENTATGPMYQALANGLNNFVNEMLVAMYTGLPPALCTASSGYDDLWHRHFDDPGLKWCQMCQAPPPGADQGPSPQLWTAGAAASAAQAQQRPALLEDLKRFLYAKLFVPGSDLEERVTLLQTQLGLVDEPYVGVHIDARVAEGTHRRDTRDFAAEAIKLCRLTDARRIFLVASEEDALHELRELLAPEGIQVVHHVVAQPPRGDSRMVAQEARAIATQAFLADLELLSRSAAFLGAASGDLDRLVWFRLGSNVTAVSLDDGGDFLFRSC
jgi:hypothetical protein